MDDLVSVEWLAAERGAADLRVLDANYLPFHPDRDPAAEYRAGHIPGARYLDLAHLADPCSPLPATVPSIEQFRARMAALGVAQRDRIVLYDDSPTRTAARAWWLLRLFGARSVAILDGGLAAWRAAGQSLETGEGGGAAIAPEATGFATREDTMLRMLSAMRGAVASGAEQIVDARGVARFAGSEPDPRPGVAPGHMPGARNLPYTSLFKPDGHWKPLDELEALFAATGIDPTVPTTFTCGSGVTAAGLFFTAHRLGYRDIALYDGSWSEWGGLPDTPKETAEA